MYNFEGKFDPCFCVTRKCQCGGGLHSYAGIYKKIIEQLEIKSCYEWGPGKNSFICLDSGLRVHSKEFDKKWIPQVDNQLYSYEILPLNDIKWPEVVSPEFWDIYFVDSRRRSECLESVYKNSREDSVVFLHDAQRSRYHDSLSSYPFVYYCTRGFSMATKSNSMYQRLKSLVHAV